MERIHSRKRGFNRPNSHNDISLGVKDINIDENHVKPTRCVNPLEPKYMWEGKVDTEGIEGASALKPKPSLPTYSLSTYDIEGATKKVNNFMSVPKE